MRDAGLEYDTAHAICSKVEFKLRQGKGATPLLVSGRGKLTKKELPKITHEDVFRYVLRHYVKK